MTMFKILCAAQLKEINPRKLLTSYMPKRSMFECDEKEPPCKTNKCKKKFGPCPGLPQRVPEEPKDWATETDGLNFYDGKNDGIKPTPPAAPPSPTFCDQVPKLSAETFSGTREPPKCCIAPDTSDDSKCKKMKPK